MTKKQAKFKKTHKLSLKGEEFMSRILLDGENQITNPYTNSHPAVDVVKKWYQQDTVIAHSAGEVVMVQTGQRHNPGSTGNASYGNFVKIKHDDGYYTLYAHLKEVYVKKGDRVNKAARLGYMGDTGNAYGVHLHFEIRNQSDVRIDPEPYLDRDLPSNVGEKRYQVYDNVKKYWLPNVLVGSNDYAGNFGNAIGGVYADTYRMRVHDMNKGYWLPWVENRRDYAGNLGNSIDGVQIENATYRVHLRGGSWLSWVNKVDNTNNGYAGIYGKAIDAIQIK